MFKYSLDNKRYHTLNYFFKNKFNCKVYKVSLNGGFTCPNIDGTKGYGGCIYCSKSGSGEFGGDKSKSLTEQFYEMKNVVNKKNIPCKYIGYFQARTNTYADLETLKAKYEEVLSLPDVIGLNIATRCDAIGGECLEYLTELNKRTLLTIELGLQTIHDKTSKLINRCHTLEQFDLMVKKLREKHINVVVHIINGLPYETEDMMLDTIKNIVVLNKNVEHLFRFNGVRNQNEEFLGKIVGIGTHNELLKNCMQYYEIASSQLTKEELENE